jgi:hypothetical protein
LHPFALGESCRAVIFAIQYDEFAIPKYLRKSLHTAPNWARNFKNSAKRMDFLLTKRKLQIIYEFLKQYRITT